MHSSRSRFVLLALIACLIPLASLHAANTGWTGGSGWWDDGGNWSNGVPGPADNAYIGAGTAILRADSQDIGSLTMTGGTLVFTNWSTRLLAADVTISNGTVTLHGAFTDEQMSNRVWFVCANDFTLGSNATIDVNGKGFDVAYGPGSAPTDDRGAYGGAGHGGAGGEGENAENGPAYGNAATPVHPGTGGENVNSGTGGGAVRIDASNGTVTIFGTIQADAGEDTGGDGAGGSGGSIYINCDTFAGNPNGLLSANGGDSSGPGSHQEGGAGAGGRIAVVYDTASQPEQPIPGVRMSAKGSLVGWTDRVAEDGTVYLPDAKFLSPVMTDQIFQDCFLVIPGFTEWRLDNLAITNCSFVFAATGMSVYVTNDLVLSDASFGAFEGGTIRCANLNLDNGSKLKMYGGVTNSGTLGYGGHVRVTNDVSLNGGSWVYPYSHPTNGGSVFFRIGGDLTIPDGNGFNANLHGFMFGYGPGNTNRSGAAYGGEGGIGRGTSYITTPYGSVTEPTLCGSGAGTGYSDYFGGGYGGGLIWIEATNGTVTLNGTLTANGQGCLTTHLSGGSGGGIYVACEKLDGSATGLVRANGGRASASSHAGGGGGGGRVAMVYDPAIQAGINPGIRFEVARNTIGRYTSSRHQSKDGSLYLPDEAFLTNVFDNAQFDNLYLTVGNQFTNWVLENLTLGQGRFAIANTNLDITVSNTVTMTHEADFGIMNGASLTCSNLVTDNDIYGNGSIFRLYGTTNGTGRSHGILLNVKDTITIVSNATIRPYSGREEGGSPLIRVKDLVIDVGGSIDAKGIGYDVNEGPGRGRGHEDGGSYGGDGGDNPGYTYGSKTAPTQPGSGAGASTTVACAGAGGGLIRLEVSGSLDLAGWLNADGNDGSFTSGGGGSGGGVFVKARQFKSSATGKITAEGGSGTASSHADGGGGGRIAIWAFEDASTATVTTNVAGGIGLGSSSKDGQTGTVFFVISAPAITNLPATNITKTSADMVAYFASTGFSPTVVNCYWGEEDEGSTAGNWQNTNTFADPEIGYMTNSIATLSEATVYHYRWYATNDAGEVWATPTESFATKGDIVLINNELGATNISDSGATLQGTVTAGTPDPNVYVCWGETNGGDASTNNWTYVEDIGTHLGDFEVTITNLLANHQYFYQCFATNTNDTAWCAATTNFTTKGPTISIGDAEVTEGNVDMDFTVSLSATSVVDVSVSYQANDGSATTAGNDYLATNGTITITASQLVGTVTVRILEDSEDEFPSENLFMTLGSPVNGTVGDGSGEGTITDDDATPETNRWNGTGNWTETGNWSQGREPRAVDHAIIETGNVLVSAPKSMMTLAIENGAVVTFTNWSTVVSASNIFVKTGGEATLPAPFRIINMTNRIHFACTNLTVEDGGILDADGLGFVDLGTPGAGSANGQYGGGAGHGGHGGRGYGDTAGGDEYGSLTSPEIPGGAGGAPNGGTGGGAIRIDAMETVTIHGTLTAGGTAGVADDGGGGAGGAILINCDTLGGSVTGLIRANAGNGHDQGGGGGGGRIAVNYATGSQATAPLPGVRFQAKGGNGWWLDGEDGTLYLPDMRFVSTTITNQLFRDVELHIPGFTSWNVANLTLDDAGFSFGEESFVLNVTNSLVLSDGAIGIVGSTTMTVGRLVMSNNSELAAWAGPTNGTLACGTLVSVTGNMVVGSSSWVYPRCDETNGGAVCFQVGGDVTIESGGGFDAYRRGFRREFGPGGGIGGSRGSGGGHGGRGADNYYQDLGGRPYGNPAKPTVAGSGGGRFDGTYHYGGWGGGIIWIECTNGNASISGTLTANAGGYNGSHGGGGAGGAIYLVCETFNGTNGLLRANGGNGSSGGGAGGGGRVAIVYDADAQGGIWPDVRCQTRHGLGGNLDGRGREAENGTTWLSDASAVSSTSWDGLFSDTYLFVPGLTELNVDSLTLDDASVTLGSTGIVINVTNALVLRNASGLGLLGNAQLHCGSLSVEDASRMDIMSGPTNGSLAAYGALINVNGPALIETSCWIYAYSDMTNGGSPLFRAGSLSVEAGSGFNANGLGYRWATGPGVAPTSRGGAGHGGIGGSGSSGIGGPAYGSSNAPVAAGSGGQNDTLGGPGGGAIRLEVNGHVDLDGTLTANGGRAPGVHGAGGSGGSVFILCDTLDGAVGSLLTARGGHSSSTSHSGGGGAGGRIAVGVGMYGQAPAFSRDQGTPLYLSGAEAGFQGTANVTGGVAKASYTLPELGTIVFYRAPPTGTVILLK